MTEQDLAPFQNALVLLTTVDGDRYAGRFCRTDEGDRYHLVYDSRWPGSGGTESAAVIAAEAIVAVERQR